jgi:hypothetical protein
MGLRINRFLSQRFGVCRREKVLGKMITLLQPQVNIAVFVSESIALYTGLGPSEVKLCVAIHALQWV